MLEEQKIKVLLVDDEETFVKVLALHLRENFGYETTVVYSGREAMKAIEESRTGFDVILLDYLMPELNGINVLQWLLEQKNETPVVMLTAAGSEQVAVEAMKLGAYDYVRKELIDIEHIDITIRGTHERHLYRVAESLEVENQKELVMNDKATDLVRLVLNEVTPRLNAALSQLSADADADLDPILRKLPEKERAELRAYFKEIIRSAATIDTIVRGIFNLFELLNAHHTEIPEIKKINSWFQKELETHHS